MGAGLGTAIFAALLMLWYGAPYAYRKLGENQLRKLCRQKRAIVLTYDDGPGEHLTERLLTALREAKVRATFFPLGHRVDRFSEIAARVAASGHEIGSHSHAHLNAWKSLPHKAHRDFLEGVERVDGLVSGAKFFRPPHGKITLALLISVLRQGSRLAWWTIDSRDSRHDRLSVDRVVGKLRRQTGGVVLMHDFDGYRIPHHDEYILTLLKSIVHFAMTEGYVIVTLGELLASCAPSTVDSGSMRGGAMKPEGRIG